MAITSSTPADTEQRANFATTARLLSCLVTESLAEALYVPSPAQRTFKGWAIILAPAVSLDVIMGKNIDSVLAAIPLHHRPVTKSNSTPSSITSIGLLDPMDMLQVIYEVTSNPPTTHLVRMKILFNGNSSLKQNGTTDRGGKLS